MIIESPCRALTLEIHPLDNITVRPQRSGAGAHGARALSRAVTRPVVSVAPTGGHAVRGGAQRRVSASLLTRTVLLCACR